MNTCSHPQQIRLLAPAGRVGSGNAPHTAEFTEYLALAIIKIDDVRKHHQAQHAILLSTRDRHLLITGQRCRNSRAGGKGTKWHV